MSKGKQFNTIKENKKTQFCILMNWSKITKSKKKRIKICKEKLKVIFFLFLEEEFLIE